jgi:hypothetical protein
MLTSSQGLSMFSTTFTSITLALHLIRHSIGRPVLKDRTFPILLLSCAASPSEFLTITLTLPSFLASSSYVPDPIRQKYSDSVIGSYVSVERIRKMEDRKIEWIMATASDAKGALPTWIQNRAVPGQISRDVPNFLAWAARERGRGK